ncbi:MAG: c-type cytochrome [Ilumatobacteraceae bacterium]
MTEIPEHLLKRAKERREALGGTEDGPASQAAPAPDAPASAGSIQPSPSATISNKPTPPAVAVVAAPPPPDPAYVVAAKTRKKIPFWAMATLSLLPLWAFVYLLALRPQEKTVEGPLAVGAGLFSTCAGCHGAEGQGGAGRVLNQGEVLKTFPQIEDMLNFVYTGSQAFATQGLAIYGNPDRDGGAHAPMSYNGNPMPQQGVKVGGGLTDVQILAVVCHERYTIGGADPTSTEWSNEYNRWCAPTSEIYAGLVAGTTDFDTIAETFKGLTDPPAVVGTTPRQSESQRT